MSNVIFVPGNIWDMPIPKKKIVVYLKFKSNEVSCSLSGNPNLTVESSLLNSVMKRFSQVLLGLYTLLEVR